MDLTDDTASESMGDVGMKCQRIPHDVDDLASALGSGDSICRQRRMPPAVEKSLRRSSGDCRRPFIDHNVPRAARGVREHSGAAAAWRGVHPVSASCAYGRDVAVDWQRNAPAGLSRRLE